MADREYAKMYMLTELNNLIMKGFDGKYMSSKDSIEEIEMELYFRRRDQYIAWMRHFMSNVIGTKLISLVLP